jgi:hypothetical protein
MGLEDAKERADKARSMMNWVEILGLD